ncbi:YraN family protein [Lampropedia puyangensis]|uniref:UPF0102 protein E9531_09860 n=2 Tax=Lampropedia puyangensis TaxID=1330072 RepID=A0A4S8F1I0_9BURK|nr:YraN family protein [Lampropedia puyangensis]
MWSQVGKGQAPQAKESIVAPQAVGVNHGARATGATAPTRKALGDQGEDWACAYLQAQGLQLVARNYRTPGRGGGEIDLIMRERDGTLVFVEVRRRQRADFGGAAASVTASKQRRIVLAAQHYLQQLGGREPPCRFDVVVLQGSALHSAPQCEWMRGAFDAA